MTQAKQPQPTAEQPPNWDEDDMLPEYHLSGNGVRGKFAQALRENGYSITIRHPDGSTTTNHVSPQEVIAQQHQREQMKQASTNQTWTGDRISGDKIAGDKIMGNKVQIGTVQGDAIIANDNSQVTNSTQINNANTAELLQLIAAMRQTAATFPKEIQDDLIIDIDDVETEIQKPGADRNLPKLKKRLIALATAGTLIATPIAGMADFANNAIDLATKIGIEMPQ